MPSIQAVLFDFGKVLSLSPNPAAWARMQQLAGLTEEQLERGYWDPRDDYDAGLFTGDVYWQRIAGRDLPHDTLKALKAADVDLWTDMNQPMLDWVHDLHAAGIRTGILSNMPDAMAEGICDRFDWIARFHHTVWSHALKLRKPQPEIYAVAVEGLDVPASSILFIDDKEENTLAAEAAGMQTVIYRNHAEFVQEMQARGFDFLLHPSQVRPAAL
ncbi:MAG: HAD family hydrolase [Janthinobacterium lividum]